MIVCPKCQTELPDKAYFCSNCGKKLTSPADRGKQAGAKKPHASAKAKGSGTVVQGKENVTAVYSGVAVGGNVYGNIYTGLPPKDDVEALLIYRRVVAQQTSQLPLRGVDVNAADPTAAQKQLGLANVYIDLDTTTEIQPQDSLREGRMSLSGRRDQLLSALGAMITHRNLVLLGDPGGGKSTFVNHIAFCLASHTLQPEAKWIDHLPNWPLVEADLLPIVIILRDFARQLPDPLPKRAEPIHLWNFITEWLKSKNLSKVTDALQRQLQAGKALVLLDGLDEVPTLAQRVFVRDAVTAFIKRYERSRFLITCRVLSYQLPATKDDSDLRVPDLSSFELAPFNEAKIDRFIGAWYGELARLGVVRIGDTDTLTRQMRDAIRRPDLWRLASNPLLLTVMALVHTHKGRLPDARALLYEETIDILLWRWEQVKSSEEVPRLRQLLLEAERTEVDLKRVLWQLAFEAQAQIGNGGDRDNLADIGEVKLLKTLSSLKDLNWAQQVIETMKLRAGLLLERAPEVFTFPHRTFQEYLAGAHLTTLDFACDACRLAEQGTQWRETILLAVGRLVYLYGEVTRPLALVGELCPAQAQDDAMSWRKTWLAGDVLVEIGTKRVADSALGRDLAERVSQRLVALLEGATLPPRERAAAGNTLARLGDPRPSVLSADILPLCFIPRGRFWLGSEESQEVVLRPEKPFQQFDLDYDYWLSRWPITNAQFREFVEAGSYGKAHYWREAQANRAWEAGQVIRRYTIYAKGNLEEFEERGAAPHDFGEPFNLPNHPVVGVSWYEALAFTRWLTECWRASGQLPTNWAVCLPNEPEWEKAACGGAEILVEPVIRSSLDVPGSVAVKPNPQPQRLYPWGDWPDPALANYSDTDINATSVVGCFLSQTFSPYGCEDLSGNVWEWLRSTVRDYPYTADDGREDLEPLGSRALRGGAFSTGERHVRCAYRGGNYSYMGDRNIGFRICVSSQTKDGLRNETVAHVLRR